MDADRFDSISRAVSRIGSRRSLLGALGGALAALLALDAIPAEARRGRRRRRKGKGKGKKHGHEKVTICHKGKTKQVPLPAVKGHEGHGDTLGPCPAACTGLPLGADCTTDAQCCSEVCNAAGFGATGDTCATCRTAGADCAAPAENTCCEPRACTAADNTECCSVIGEPCGDGDDCCDRVNADCHNTNFVCCVNETNPAPGGCPGTGINTACCFGTCDTVSGNCTVP